MHTHIRFNKINYNGNLRVRYIFKISKNVNIFSKSDK